jgi:hypothetical protein
MTSVGTLAISEPVIAKSNRGKMGHNARLSLDTIHQIKTQGIPTWTFHDMQWDHIERLANSAPGSYEREPEKVYLAVQRNCGTCMIDQYLARNPLTMGSRGYTQGAHSATTGRHDIVLDGISIDSPEAAVLHMEKFYLPSLREKIAAFDEQKRVLEIIAAEQRVQDQFGPEILKVPYAVATFPTFRYGTYGYENYFMAYALYPEICEQCFSVEADLALLNNRAVARAYREGALPPMLRLDHDMADSRGTLVDIRTLDKCWFPHFARCLEPLLKSDVRLIWHCDGNLMQMVPRLLEVGLKGFQGFQYEDGMDYIKICNMRSKHGESLLIIGGVSVTTTMPRGTPEDVRRELRFLVDNGPKTGLFLGFSSSLAPGAPWENVIAVKEGFEYYRTHGRG